MKNVLYAQLIGVAAMLTISFSVQCRKKKHMMMVQSFAHMLYAFQYALLGAISAAYMDIMAVVRNILFYKYDKNRRQVPIVLSGIIIIVTGIIGYLNYTNPLSLLPVIIIFFCPLIFVLKSFDNLPLNAETLKSSILSTLFSIFETKLTIEGSSKIKALSIWICAMIFCASLFP